MNGNVKVTIERTEGVAALKIPRERLEAVAQEIVQTGLTDPHWAKQLSYSITLDYEWGQTPMTLVVKRDGSMFDVVFMLKSEVEKAGFRRSDAASGDVALRKGPEVAGEIAERLN